MKPTRAIAALAVAGALSVAASAQVAEVDPNAQPTGARAVATSQRPQPQSPAPTLTTPGQGAEIVLGGSSGGDLKAGGFTYSYTNGSFVTGIGNGAGGADTSQIVNGGTLGYGVQASGSNRLADDFPVGSGQTVTLDQLVWRAYQTGAPTTGTITGIDVRLWDLDPTTAGSPDQTGPANSFVSQVWSGVYRVSGTTLGDTNRAIIDVTADLTWAAPLTAGKHWVDVALAGSASFSGPWAPPVVPELFGDARQSVGGAAFIPLADDFPFQVSGNLLGVDCGWVNGPFVTGIGDGFGGADTSTATGTFGYGTQGGTINNRIADDFTVPSGDAWTLDRLSWKAYQTGAPTTGTITGINSDLWSSDPGVGGSASQSGPANSLIAQTWTGVYRVTATSLDNADRAIIDVTGDMSWAAPLTAGKYWVDVTLTGSLTSGPWSVPRFPEGAGNAYQSLGGGAYTPLVDDFPFELSVVCASDGPEVYCEGKTNSCGANPLITAPSGLTSQAASGTGTYDITVAPVSSKNFGLLFYTTDGKMAPVLNQYGTLCINTKSGLFRVLPVVGGQGTGCNASFTFDFGNYLATQNGNPLLTAAGLAVSGGEIVDAQVWYRDPTSPGTANLTKAIRFLVVP